MHLKFVRSVRRLSTILMYLVINLSMIFSNRVRASPYAHLRSYKKDGWGMELGHFVLCLQRMGLIMVINVTQTNYHGVTFNTICDSQYLGHCLSLSGSHQPSTFMSHLLIKGTA